ncbi:MAG: hypothetical protein Q8Q95_04020, partial [bacterium]|nr:hypothetical protein [bacterium]
MASSLAGPPEEHNGKIKNIYYAVLIDIGAGIFRTTLVPEKEHYGKVNYVYFAITIDIAVFIA